MKVSLSTAGIYSNVGLAPNGVDDLVQKIGSQLGEVENVTLYGPRYDGIVVAKVISCEKHPDADKLSICLIDDGGKVQGVERNASGQVQVVCGAPNVREGMVAAWIPPGVTVPVTYDKDPFVLEAKELRGVMSNGMLASASELAISSDHAGLLEIDAEDAGEELTRPGTEFKKLYDLDDVVIEIENKMFTRRPDCFGLIGVDREIAGIYKQQYATPDWYSNQPQFKENNKLPLAVSNELPELVPRFMAVAMDSVSIKPSPVWIQALLTKIGVKPINNIVDMTNYLAYATGQPLHAYDYEKIKSLSDSEAEIVVRMPKSGEKVALLNGKTIEPRDEAIMIASDKELVGIGGVMGGKSTEVDNNTKSIIIECANFDMFSIRRTSMAHGLFTDAVTRFTKGQSPYQLDRVLFKAMEMANELAGAEQASSVIDAQGSQNTFNSPGKYTGLEVHLEQDFINNRLGSSYSVDEIKAILQNVEFGVNANDNELVISVPFWRTDILIPEDIVEEVARLEGFDKLPLDLPKKTVSPSVVDPVIKQKSRVRAALSRLGANEVLSYSFVNGKLLEKAGQDTRLGFKLSNALSPDLQFYRLSLTPSLLNLVHPNIKSGHNQFTIFEIGKVHGKSEIGADGVPNEFGRVSLVVADRASSASAYYGARAYADEITYKKLNYIRGNQNLHKDHQLFQQMLAPYDPDRSALLMDQENLVGVVGEFKTSVIKAFKLPVFCAGFELFLSPLGKITPPDYVPLSNYPSIIQDICLEIDANKLYSEIWATLNDVIASQAGEDQVDADLLDIFADPRNPAKKRITFRLNVFSYERTLQEEHVNLLLEKIAENMASRIGSVRI